ncbi:hypothetical protein U1Q18_028479 [Sarracenia purpurea var. burkii]
MLQRQATITDGVDTTLCRRTSDATHRYPCPRRPRTAVSTGKLHQVGVGKVLSYLLQALRHMLAMTMDPMMRTIQ